jgi:ATP-dependent exoDNAse (exonuclease V) alpha subunit
MTTFTADQDNTLNQFVSFMLDPDRKVMVINGRPGCGKTYMIPHLIDKANDISKFLSALLNSENSLQFQLTATTNQAAEVLAQKTGRPTSTIHSFLGLRVQNDFGTGKTKLIQTNAWQVYSNTIIFVDEMSMADTELLNYIDKATINCKVVYVLDKNQILPVFESEIPLIKKYPVDVNLTQIVRQGAGNPIINYAHALCDAIENNTKIPQIPASNEMVFLEPAEFKQKLIDSFNEPDAEHRFKILAWTNNRVLKYNAFIRGLNHASDLIEVGEFLVSNDTYSSDAQGQNTILKNQEEIQVIKASDLMLCPETEIEYQLITYKRSNGYTYTVKRPLNYENVSQLLKYYGRMKNYSALFALKNEMLDLRPVHACTVHKSQGSTYESVFLDLDDICANNKINEVKRLILVGITRASYKVYLRGSIPSKYLL